MYNKKLILADGTVFHGNGFGADKEAIAELVFNTGMTGYQEILSDPSYFGQMIVMTYPLIGNYGINADDFESSMQGASAIIVKEHAEVPSNWRSSKTLSEYLMDAGIVGLTDVDTRALTIKIRDNGETRAIIVDKSVSNEDALKKLNETPLLKRHVDHVAPKEMYTVAGNGKHIVLVDFGAKKGIIDHLIARGCKVTVVPFTATLNEINELNPNGILLSNGPGDPKDVTEVLPLIQELQKKYPLFGICLGHQLFALANGADTKKMKFGHHGCNQPVKDLTTNRVHITSQNHGYAVDPDSIEKTDLEITHIALNDNSVEGVKHKKYNAFTVQYHPEANPGPDDASYLFDMFMENMEKK